MVDIDEFIAQLVADAQLPGDKAIQGLRNLERTEMPGEAATEVRRAQDFIARRKELIAAALAAIRGLKQHGYPTGFQFKVIPSVLAALREQDEEIQRALDLFHDATGEAASVTASFKPTGG
jgi:hypothetical protein